MEPYPDLCRYCGERSEYDTCEDCYDAMAHFKSPTSRPIHENGRIVGIYHVTPWSKQTPPTIEAVRPEGI